MSYRRVLAKALVPALCLSAAATAQAAPGGSNGPIFYSLTSAGKVQRQTIGVMAADGSGDHQIVGSVKLDAYAPSVSTDGRRLAYLALTGHGTHIKSGVQISAIDGSGAQAIPNTSNVGGTVAWSNDGGRLIYPTVKSGLVSQPSTGGASTVLFKDLSILDAIKEGSFEGYGSPHITADGTLLYLRFDFADVPQGKDSVSLTSAVWSAAAGPQYFAPGALTRLFSASGNGPLIFDFDVAPAGDRFASITSTSIRKEPRVLAVGSKTGADIHQLAAVGPAYRGFSSPVWSPDGTKIAIAQHTSSPKHGSELDVIDVATGAITVVKKVSKGTIEAPFWAPAATA